MAFGTCFPGVKAVDVPEPALTIPTMDRQCDHARQSSDTFRLFFATSFLIRFRPGGDPRLSGFVQPILDPDYAVFCQKFFARNSAGSPVTARKISGRSQAGE